MAACRFLFQLTTTKSRSLPKATGSFCGQQDYRTSIIESFVFSQLSWFDEEWGRGRDLPALRGRSIGFSRCRPSFCSAWRFRFAAVIDRRPNKKGRFTRCNREAHIPRQRYQPRIATPRPYRYLCDIALAAVKGARPGHPNEFPRSLRWLDRSVVCADLEYALYRELANWYFWSTKIVELLLQ